MYSVSTAETLLNIFIHVQFYTAMSANLKYFHHGTSCSLGVNNNFHLWGLLPVHECFQQVENTTQHYCLFCVTQEQIKTTTPLTSQAKYLPWSEILLACIPVWSVWHTECLIKELWYWFWLKYSRIKTDFISVVNNPLFFFNIRYTLYKFYFATKCAFPQIHLEFHIIFSPKFAYIFYWVNTQFFKTACLGCIYYRHCGMFSIQQYCS